MHLYLLEGVIMDININVSDKVRKATTKCNKDFACLKKNGKPSCAVEDCINDQVLFVSFLNNEYCPYRESFGNEFICGCPVRKALFDKYRI